MKTFLQVAGILVLIFGGMVFVGAIFSDDKEDQIKGISERHCELEWETANDSIKEKALNEFIDNGGIYPVDREIKSPGQLAAELLNKSVKYPETITIDGDELQGWISLRSATIEDVDEGVISYSKNFIAKNKLNMDVRSRFLMKLKYQAGCENYNLVDFQVE